MTLRPPINIIPLRKKEVCEDFTFRRKLERRGEAATSPLFVQLDERAEVFGMQPQLHVFPPERNVVVLLRSSVIVTPSRTELVDVICGLMSGRYFTEAKVAILELAFPCASITDLIFFAPSGDDPETIFEKMRSCIPMLMTKF